MGGEVWNETVVYELRGISGKNSARSKEMERLFADIHEGRVNTVICTSIERLCRSLKDFLNLCEFFVEHGVEFIALKQQYDTTTPQRKLFVTILMALAEFEREQTAERTRDAALARAERGLWNGGHLFGYDLDPLREGYLVPNPDEEVVVNVAFDRYLQIGSIAETAAELNKHCLLIRLVIRRATISDRELVLVLEMNGGAIERFEGNEKANPSRVRLEG